MQTHIFNHEVDNIDQPLTYLNSVAQCRSSVNSFQLSLTFPIKAGRTSSRVYTVDSRMGVVMMLRLAKYPNYAVTSSTICS